MLTLYHEQSSVLHRLPASTKILLLMAAGTLIFLVENLWVMGGVFAAVIGLLTLSRVPFPKAYDQLKPAFFLLAIIFVAQLFIANLELASLIILRFASLILLASIVTLTTKTSDIVATIERALTPFSRWIAVEKVSLAISLTIRFIPVLGGITMEVREAQKVRGLDRSLFALTMPVIIRTLKMGSDVADALDARSFGSETESDVHERRS
jgi:biotin transport system permease protein